MRVLFSNSRGERREIATVDSIEKAMSEISKFCSERDYIIPYSRTIFSEEGLKIDVGSYSEFFYVEY